MVFSEKKHTHYALGLALCGIVLIGGQWFDNDPGIQRLAALVFMGSIGLSLLSAYTSFTGLSAFLLTPLASAIPLIGIGSILYLAGAPLTAVGMSISIAIITLLVIFLPLHRPLFPKQLRLPIFRPTLLGIGFFVSICISFAILFSSQTKEAILGPWQAVHPSFFLFYALASLFLLWSCMRSDRQHLIHLTLYGILSTSVALITFPLGFGFDPFIHEAAQSHIARYGILEPKTYYYIGHYALTVILSKLFEFDISTISRIIVPIGSILSLIPLCSAAFKKPLIVALFFLVPYPFLIVSTPWGFAYGITALTVVSSMLSKTGFIHRSIPFLLGSSALLIHPLAGIPALFFASLHPLLRITQKYTLLLRSLSIGGWFVAGTMSIPAAFLLNSLLSSQLAISFSWPQWSWPAILTFQTRFSFVLDPIYFYSQNLFLILILACIPGALSLWKQGLSSRHIACAGILAWGTTLLHSFALTHILTFPSLISYERDDYGNRLIWLAFLFLIPLLAESVRLLIAKLFAHDRPHLIKIAGTCVIVATLTASLYLSYPRNDAFQAFHGYNVSSADIEAVQWIHADAASDSTIVLANQVVSSALIHEYGFGGDVFHYSLPTSSPLYALYLEMLRKPSTRVIEEARKIHSDARVYIVLNAYEPRFPLISMDLKRLFPRWTSFGNGSVIVFAAE